MQYLKSASTELNTSRMENFVEAIKRNFSSAIVIFLDKFLTIFPFIISIIVSSSWISRWYWERTFNFYLSQGHFIRRRLYVENNWRVVNQLFFRQLNPCYFGIFVCNFFGGPIRVHSTYYYYYIFRSLLSKFRFVWFMVIHLFAWPKLWYESVSWSYCLWYQMLSTGIQNITAVRKLYGTLCNVNINKINRVQKILYFLYFSRILDDVEMYEKQSPFKLSDFIVMSNFLNLFIYKAVVGNLLGNFIFLFFRDMLFNNRIPKTI